MQSDAPLHGSEPGPEPGLGFERLVFFSDAVFAIGITLLVLDLKLPLDAHGEVDLDRLAPKLLGFVISFMVTGLYWLAHHRLFETLRDQDGLLRGVNLIYLACVVFLAFPSSVVTEHPTATWAVIFYALSVAATGLMHVVLVLVARRPALIRAGETTGGTASMAIRALGAPLTFIATTFVALERPLLAAQLWMVLPLTIRLAGLVGRTAGRAIDKPVPGP